MPVKGRGRKRQGPRADSRGRRNSSIGFEALSLLSVASICNEGSRLSNKHSHENTIAPQAAESLWVADLCAEKRWPSCPADRPRTGSPQAPRLRWIADLGAALKCSSRESGGRHRIQCDGIRGLVKLVWRPLLSTRQIPMFAPAHLYCARSRVLPTLPQALIVLLHRASKRPFG